jgi:hypothetical protein
VSAASVVARSVGGDPAERRRRRLLAAAVSGCAAFALAAVGVASLQGEVGQSCTVGPDASSVGCTEAPGPVSLAPYVAQSGLRPGVVTAALLLVVPFAVFAVQVLRLGSAARERRLAALRVHGATSSDLRRIAVAEAWPAALAGGVLGLPVLGALWVVLGVLPPPGWRLVPAPGPAVLVAWPLVAVGLAAAAGGAAAWASRSVADDALGRSRRAVRPLSAPARVAPIVLVTLLVLSAAPLMLAPSGSAQVALVVLLPILLVAFAVSCGPWLVVLAGRLCIARGSPVAVVAGRRLLADPVTPGRVAGVLFAVGVAVGAVAAGGTDFLVMASGHGYDVVFYLGGYGLALGGIALAMVVAGASLVVGAAEQVFDGRRPTAALVALGAAPSTVRRILGAQLAAAAVVPAGVGAGLGVLLFGALFTASAEASGPLLGGLLVAGAAAVAVCMLAAAAGALVAGRLLAGPLTEAMSAQSLRTA